jgi:hypothetical protein
MTILRDLTHRKARSAQVGLSYFFLAGFFGIIMLEGLGWIKFDVMGQLGPMAMLVLSFWFQRQRSSSDEASELHRGPDPVNPIAPPSAANSQ